MAVTYDSFLTAFPEFVEITANIDGRALIEAKIAEATLQTDPEIWGAHSDLGVSYLAAHLLAVSPCGQNARLVSKDGATTYGVRRREMVRQVAGGARVI